MDRDCYSKDKEKEKQGGHLTFNLSSYPLRTLEKGQIMNDMSCRVSGHFKQATFNILRFVFTTYNRDLYLFVRQGIFFTF